MAKNPGPLNAPSIVLVLLGMFAAVHLYVAFLDTDGWFALLVRFAFIPARYGGAAAHLLDFPGGLPGDIWTFVSYMFLHADLTHVLVNGFWLLAFGSLLARRFSTAGFLMFSLACGVGGALAHLLFNWGMAVPMIGASAAISGQMAAAVRFIFSSPSGMAGALRAGDRIASLPALPLTTLFRIPQVLIFLGVWLGINLFFGLGAVGLPGMGDVAWEAHIGGFLVGLLGFDWFDRRFGLGR